MSGSFIGRVVNGFYSTPVMGRSLIAGLNRSFPAKIIAFNYSFLGGSHKAVILTDSGITSRHGVRNFGCGDFSVNDAGVISEISFHDAKKLEEMVKREINRDIRFPTLDEAKFLVRAMNRKGLSLAKEMGGVSWIWTKDYDNFPPYFVQSTLIEDDVTILNANESSFAQEPEDVPQGVGVLFVLK